MGFIRHQQTVAQSISCTGVGLHTNRSVTLTLRPAPPDTGIVFIRERASGPVSIGAFVWNLVTTDLCTTVGTQGAQIRTVEHVLSALAGSEVDNVYVDLDAPEVPAMDGSAGAFVQLIRRAGVAAQPRRQPFLKITQPIEVKAGDRVLRIEPSPAPRITYTIKYDHPLILTQTYDYNGSVPAFQQDIADARTFAFLSEVEALWARGLGQGGSLENTVVLSDSEVVNQSGLRFQDEFVRHKILDLIGDLALLGVPCIAHVVAHRSGHALHTKMVESILAQPDKWVLLNADEQAAEAMSRRRPDSVVAGLAVPPHVASPAV